MAKQASKNISFSIKRRLLRNSPRKIRKYNGYNSCLQFYPLIESFSQNDFVQYELLLRNHGTPGRKKEILIEILDKNNIKSGPCRELAEIRAKDLDLHRKILQHLRHIWYDLGEYKKDKFNENPDNFWDELVHRISKTPVKRPSIHLSTTWQGEGGKQALKKLLIDLFNKQQGKCAITGIPLVLKLGKNKPLPNRCSVDRINSSFGYTPKNIWLVTWWVNSMKSNMSMSDFKKKVLIIAESFKKIDTNLK